MIAKLAVLCIVSGTLGLPRPGLKRAGPGSSGSTVAGFEDESLLPAEPYAFDNDNVDEYGNKQFHKEQSDINNVKTGSYGYTDSNGIFRSVKYVADADGFRAKVETNEPGTKAADTADAIYNANPIVLPPVIKLAGAPQPKKNGPGPARSTIVQSG